MISLVTFRVHLQRAIFETFDLWDIWSKWWENMTWPTKKQFRPNFTISAKFHNPGILEIPGVRAVLQFLRCLYLWLFSLKYFIEYHLCSHCSYDWCGAPGDPRVLPNNNCLYLRTSIKKLIDLPVIIILRIERVWNFGPPLSVDFINEFVFSR